MKIYLIDTEFLSWNKKQSEEHLRLRPKSQPPELIQIFIQEIFTKHVNQKILYIKPTNYRVYPYRISKLTGINKKFLDDKGLDFKVAYKSLVKFIPKNSLVISNGDEYKILESNIKINKIKKANKKIYFLNFYNLIKDSKLFNKYKDLNFIPVVMIKEVLKLKLKSHDAKNDVTTLFKCIKKIGIQKSDLKKYFKHYKLYKI
tara:strand:- start:119 stop:724 length:606 start_codon:yes stop_codon:yes gene_type:complete